MKPEMKKLIIANLPYLLFVYLFGKLGQAYRLAEGIDLSQKLLHFADGCAAAFESAAPSFHLFDLLIGVAGAAALRLMVYCKGKNAKKYRKGVEYGSARWSAWATKTVVHILERLDYLGHTVNFKTSKQSFKSKKVLWNDPADWVIFENTQEPIIEESVFLIVQKIRQGRRRPTKMGDMGMFSGLLFCADCGGKMYLCRANHFKPEQEYYLCSTYRKDRTLCSTHSIRRVVLEEIVLRNLREAIQYVTQYEDDFVQRAADQSLRERDKELAQKKDTLAQSQKRIAELDVIIKRLYEDNISGKLSDERFIKLSRDYELEQTNLTNLVEHLRQEVKEQEKQKVNVRQFIAAVRKYTDMQQLDASILREFVDKIYISEVYTPDDNEPRIKVREIEIVYNFIGAFDFEEAREQSQAAQKEKKTGVA